MKNDPIELRMYFSRSQLRVGAALGLLLGLVYALKSVETMRLSTYYPAPSGVYKKIITTAQTILARDGGGVGIGTSNPLLPLQVKMNPALSPSSIAQFTTTDFEAMSKGSSIGIGLGSSSGKTYARIQAATGGTQNEGQLILQPSAGNVGIGTTTPQTRNPKGEASNLDVNDIYLRSIGQWLSKGGSGTCKVKKWDPGPGPRPSVQEFIDSGPTGLCFTRITSINEEYIEIGSLQGDIRTYSYGSAVNLQCFKIQTTHQNYNLNTPFYYVTCGK